LWHAYKLFCSDIILPPKSNGVDIPIFTSNRLEWLIGDDDKWAALYYSPDIIHNMTQLRFLRALPGRAHYTPLSFLRVVRNNEELRVRVWMSREAEITRGKSKQTCLPRPFRLEYKTKTRTSRPSLADLKLCLTCRRINIPRWLIVPCDRKYIKKWLERRNKPSLWLFDKFFFF